MRLEGDTSSKRHARDLRQSMPLPEILLWQALRRSARGHRFRRQHPIGPYIADFYCFASRLIVEVDGEAHNRGNAPAHDARRDAWLTGLSLHVLRIPAIDVLRDLDAVVRRIVEQCDRRAPYDRLRRPPPPGGEELKSTEPNSSPSGGGGARSATEGV